MTPLAIIIPAYKSKFLAQTLESFAVQTDLRFKLYIGDDNSPEDIEEIVNRFRDKMDIHYVRFDHNLGGTSLVKHWERCIRLSNEPWIWLFSDDDRADNTCVEKFYKTLNEVKSELYRFALKRIDEHNKILQEDPLQGTVMTAGDFITGRLYRGFMCYAVEFIFSRRLFDTNGFVDFPLAWCSDDATWTEMMLANNGIVVHIPEAYVLWRLSSSNISGRALDDRYNKKKDEAVIQFLAWLKSKEQVLGTSFPAGSLTKWIAGQIISSRKIYSKEKLRRMFGAGQLGLDEVQIRYLQRQTIISNCKQKIKRFLRLK